MFASWKNRADTWWLGLSLILPLLYLCQVVPHEHHVPVHAESHSVPIQHANHSHSHHEHSDHATDLPEQGHHHHALAHHLDFHFLRTPSQRPNSVPNPVVQVSHLRLDAEKVSIHAEHRKLEDLIPDPIPIAPFDPRGPPLLN